jgi:hypothetical protein
LTASCDSIFAKNSVHLYINNMTTKSIVGIGLLSLISSCLYPHQLLAQLPSKAIQTNPSSYEDDRIKVVIQDCTRKLQDIVCQAILTSKSSDRSIDLNGNTIKLVDLEGNEYYPTSIRLANRSSENNSIKTELIENIPFKASFVFGKVPTNLTQVALLQIPLTGGVIATAKFRNVAIVGSSGLSSGSRNNSVAKPVNIPVASASSVSSPKSASVNREANTSVCPDNTQVLYRASSSDYLLYICGAKNPTHYVGLAKDGTQGITLRLRYYDRTQFSADNGDVNYTIAANRLVIRKNNKVIFQDRIQVLQALSGTKEVEAVVPKTKVRKNSSVVNSTNSKRNSTVQPVTKVKRQPANAEE